MPDADLGQGSKDARVVRRVAGTYLWPRWRSLLATIGCAIVFAILTGTLVKLLQPAMNDLSSIAQLSRGPNVSRAAVAHKYRSLIQLAIVLGALAIIKGAVQIGQSTLVNRIGNGVVGDIQLRLFNTLVRADMSRLRATHTGAWVSSMLYDAGLIREAATSGLVSLAQQSLTLVAMAVVMFLTDWRLSLFVFLAGPVVAVALRRFSRHAGRAARGAMEATSALSTTVMESLDGVRVVKMENNESYEADRVARAVAGRQSFILAGDNARARAAPISETLMTLVVACVLVYEGWQASLGHMDVGGFVAFFAALLQAGQALRQVANYPGMLAQGLTASRRLFAVLDIEPEVRDQARARPLVCRTGTIRFTNVSFSYAGVASTLEDISLEVHRGERIALVGPSGAGKTTVLNLIPRFYDVSHGRVAIDDQDIRQVTTVSLRNNIALVTQEPFLFDDTIAANIAYARQGASEMEIQAAAQAAAAHDFIQALPAGYQTIVGEGGMRLSGGQRQRISVARAFLKNAPILLLDEATSAVDAESEAQIQTALDRLMAGRSTLVIAHRLSTVRTADRIYVLDKGRIVETGSHDALVAMGGLYARLAQTQTLDRSVEGGA